MGGGQRHNAPGYAKLRQNGRHYSANGVKVYYGSHHMLSSSQSNGAAFALMEVV